MLYFNQLSPNTYKCSDDRVGPGTDIISLRASWTLPLTFTVELWVAVSDIPV